MGPTLAETQAMQIKLARIEEGIVHLNETVDEIKKSLVPKMTEYAVAIAELKRDRNWIIWIASATGGTLGSMAALLVEFVRR